MTAREITEALGYSAPVSACDVKSVVQYPSSADADSIFVCIRGARHDGHDHAATAYARGCRLFVAEHPLTLPPDATVLTVDNTRSALARLACKQYGDPARKMRIIGITGTKGKTTVACMIRHILDGAGILCGYIGTNGIAYGDTTIPLSNTTPDPLTLQSTLAQMADSGIKAVVLEVSSQGVYQSRIDGICFDACVYTNLYPDHIGEHEHPDFDHYRSCKHRLFTDYACRTMIYNADDANAALMVKDTSATRIFSYALQKQDADFVAKTLIPRLSDTEYRTEFSILYCNDTVDVQMPLLGAFNVTNALAALAVATTCFEIPLSRAAQLLSGVAVTGRTELMRLANGAYAVIDYAHNGASLEHLLLSLRTYKPQRLICLFGSVGERTQLRRRELGAVAAKHCDLAILTSDNPGKEDPQAIIDEIAKAFEGTSTPYLSVVDRAEAIRTAVAHSRAGDILVLAGKGHEKYQLIGRQKIPYSDREVLESLIQ